MLNALQYAVIYGAGAFALASIVATISRNWVKIRAALRFD